MNDPTGTAGYPIASAPTPAPDDGPAAALRRQLDALADDDAPTDDAGIETAYNFASPAIRRRTGSYDRFARLLRSPRYAPLVDHVEAVTGPLERDWNEATRRVTVTGPDGRTRTYEFRLSPAATGPFRNCWQTDAVVVV